MFHCPRCKKLRHVATVVVACICAQYGLAVVRHPLERHDAPLPSRAAVKALTVLGSTVNNDGTSYATDTTSGARYSTSPPIDTRRPLIWIA